ncbi:hypothetical protein X963_5663 [Burkholderia pseudomallei MSHR7498]|nr:hypothetical protein X963_5663 [Burkholderia pseudomallei MSHR7498]
MVRSLLLTGCSKRRFLAVESNHRVCFFRVQAIRTLPEILSGIVLACLESAGSLSVMLDVPSLGVIFIPTGGQHTSGQDVYTHLHFRILHASL